MSDLLERAIAEARKAPEDVQEMIASLILEEIEDDRRWEEAFARLPRRLPLSLFELPNKLAPGESAASLIQLVKISVN